MSDTPLVSAVIPAYNSEAVIRRALESVAAQDYPAIELIVADDCSSDRTCDIVRSFGALPPHLVRLPVNRGASAARNAGIAAASGKYVAFLDSDDAWLPDKISRQVALAESRPAAGLITCDCLFLDAAGRETKRSHAQNPATAGPHAWKALLANNFIPTPTAMARLDLVREVGGFDPRYRIAEDLDLWIRLAVASEVAVAPEVLVEVHDRPGSLHKSNNDVEQQSILAVVETNLERQRHRLTPDEIRAIRGSRYFKLGSNFYCSRQYRESLSAFLRAARLGFRPVKSVFNVQRAIWKLVVARP